MNASWTVFIFTARGCYSYDSLLLPKTMEKLKEQLRLVNILYSEQSFETTEDILLLGGDIFVSLV